MNPIIPSDANDFATNHVVTTAHARVLAQGAVLRTFEAFDNVGGKMLNLRTRCVFSVRGMLNALCRAGFGQ